MTDNNSLDQKVQTNDLKIEELSIRLESLNREVTDFLEVLQINLDQIAAFNANKENFSEENWQDLIKHKKELEDKLHKELSNIKNPLKTKQAYSNLQIQRHWLYVR